MVPSREAAKSLTEHYYYSPACSTVTSQPYRARQKNCVGRNRIAQSQNTNRVHYNAMSLLKKKKQQNYVFILFLNILNVFIMVSYMRMRVVFLRDF